MPMCGLPCPGMLRGNLYLFDQFTRRIRKFTFSAENLLLGFMYLYQLKVGTFSPNAQADGFCAPVEPHSNIWNKLGFNTKPPGCLNTKLVKVVANTKLTLAVVQQLRCSTAAGLHKLCGVAGCSKQADTKTL